MYGKLIHGTLIPAPAMLRQGGCDVYHPSAAQLLAAGYRPVVETPCPEPTPGAEPVRHVSHYEEQDGALVRVWSVAPPEAEPTPPAGPTVEERLSAVEGAVIELAEVIANG